VQRWIRGIDRSGGRLLRRSIPGRTSGFAARAALVYVPPAARHPDAHLPVLLLLHGEPGGPQDWIRHSTLLRSLNDFAAQHHGSAPVVVMPDINGAPHRDTECVGDAEQYLATDVPDYVRAHFPVASSAQRWAVGGVSEGGWCSLMLALRHEQRFRSFVDLSGLTRPTVGRTDDPGATVERLFGGSRSAYRQHDPMWLLAQHRFTSLSGWFAVGARDTRAAAAQARVVSAARRAGITVSARLEPGAHDWGVWDRAITQCLPWLWARLGGR
jgi:S-formylglutathione hydrolase FrmB